MPKVNFNKHIIYTAVHDYLNSKSSLTQMGEKYGMTGGNIRHWILKMGFKVRGQHEANFDSERIKECVDLYTKGESSLVLAKKYKVTRRTVAFWLNENGIKPKTFNQVLGVTDEIKKEARKLYKEGLTCFEISKIIGFSDRSISDWLGGIKMTQSESACQRVAKNKGLNSNSVKGWMNTKFGNIFFSSSYERDRITQILNNNDVVFLGRCKDRIPYYYNEKLKHYNPDFYVEYKDGARIVEEIKPSGLIDYSSNPIKTDTAIDYYSNKNITFKVVTEKLIYGKIN